MILFIQTVSKVQDAVAGVIGYSWAKNLILVLHRYSLVASSEFN